MCKFRGQHAVMQHQGAVWGKEPLPGGRSKPHACTTLAEGDQMGGIKR